VGVDDYVRMEFSMSVLDLKDFQLSDHTVFAGGGGGD